MLNPMSAMATLIALGIGSVTKANAPIAVSRVNARVGKAVIRLTVCVRNRIFARWTETASILESVRKAAVGSPVKLLRIAMALKAVGTVDAKNPSNVSANSIVSVTVYVRSSSSALIRAVEQAVPDCNCATGHRDYAKNPLNAQSILIVLEAAGAMLDHVSTHVVQTIPVPEMTFATTACALRAHAEMTRTVDGDDA